MRAAAAAVCGAGAVVLAVAGAAVVSPAEPAATPAQVRAVAADVDVLRGETVRHEQTVNGLRAELTETQRKLDDARRQLAAVRASRSRPPAARPSTPAPTSPAKAPRAAPSVGDLRNSSRWAATSDARAVAECESGGDPRAVSRTGKYRGKWQADPAFWRSHGGLRYASRPDLASEAEQDAVAYDGWRDRGWQPWECARIVGVA